MFEQGDIVRIKSLDEVLDIEGVEHISDIQHPNIALRMMDCFDKEGVVVDVTDGGYIRVYANGETWIYNPNWLEKTRDMITLKDFEKNIIDLGFYMSKESNILRVYNKDDQFVMSLDLLQRGCVDTHLNGFTYIEDWGTRYKLLELGVKLASTPIDERESDVKYYLRLPEPIHDDYAYLNRELDLGTYLFGCKYDDSVYKTQFTQEEIDDLPNQEFIKTLIKEEVEGV